METFGNSSYRQSHTELSRHVLDAGVGNIQGMRYFVFRKWMNVKKGGAKCINTRTMKDVEHFTNHWEGEKLGSWHIHCVWQLKMRK